MYLPKAAKDILTELQKDSIQDINMALLAIDTADIVYAFRNSYLHDQSQDTRFRIYHSYFSDSGHLVCITDRATQEKLFCSFKDSSQYRIELRTNTYSCSTTKESKGNAISSLYMPVIDQEELPLFNFSVRKIITEKKVSFVIQDTEFFKPIIESFMNKKENVNEIFDVLKLQYDFSNENINKYCNILDKIFNDKENENIFRSTLKNSSNKTLKP